MALAGRLLRTWEARALLGLAVGGLAAGTAAWAVVSYWVFDQADL